jgi:glucose/arabinose dehydrogenase
MRKRGNSTTNSTSIFLSLILIFGLSILVGSLIGSTRGMEPSVSKVTYGCVPISGGIHCDKVLNRFSSFLVSGHAREIYQFRPDYFEGVSGKLGNALPLKGYIGEYLSVPNNRILNPDTFSVSFWIKQDPVFGIDGSVLSHVNLSKTAGWFFETKIKPEPQIQFSVVNSEGTIFTVAAPINKNKFENVVGSFDEISVKLYLNGVLVDSTDFSGTYEPDPESPFNVGIDSYDLNNAWKGAIDDLRIFNRVLSVTEVKNSFEGAMYSSDGLIGYWPFDNNTKDLSGKQNDANVASQAVSMAFSPDGRLFFTEKNVGDVRIMKDDQVLTEPFLKIPDLYVAQHQGLLGITLDPKFSTNHFVYVYYTSQDTKTGEIFNKVLRLTDLDDKATQELVLLDKIPGSPEGEYAGGALGFGLDDKLYITSGYANFYDLPQNKSSLLGKVLRINRDGTIPSDNPFPNSPVYTLGHRNIFGIAFDKNGTGVVTENGESHYDEINILKKGGTYGFPNTQPPSRSPLLDNSSSVKPIRTYWVTVAPTQAIFYYGDKFGLLKNKFLFGSYNQGSIYVLGLNSTHYVSDEMVINFPEIVENTISIAQSPSGDIYFGGYKIYKLTSIQTENKEQNLYFIDLTTHSARIEDLSFNSTSSTLAISANTDGGNLSSTAPTMQVSIPKSLQSGNFEVTSSGNASMGNKTLIKDFTVNQQRITSNTKDIVLHILLNKGTQGTVLIKATGSDFEPKVTSELGGLG